MEPARRLREALVERLVRIGCIRSEPIAAAMRAVERHRFLPHVDARDAYADRAIALKVAGDEVLSSISQPAMIAGMLELLDVQPGERILEIGTGSGYHAALLAELVGASGRVTTVELDDEIAAAARERLSALGYVRVDARALDGSRRLDLGCFDRIAVTARSDDLLDPWWDALREGGRIVVPLQLDRVGEFAIAFERRGDRANALGLAPCAFIALRGAGIDADVEAFYRDPDDRARDDRARRVIAVEAVRRHAADVALLARNDLVIARRATLFGVTFG